MRHCLQVKPNLLLKTGHPVRARASEPLRVAATAARREKGRRVVVTAPLRKAAAKAKTKVRTKEKGEENLQVLTEKEKDMALTMAKAKATGEPILHLFATMPSIRFARDNKGTYNVYTLFRLLKTTVVVLFLTLSY